MKLIVNPHKIEILKEPVNEREIDITKCEFEFADEITDEFTKEAYFTLNGETYKQIIVNDECDIPYEVLRERGTVEIGVVAFIVENEEEIKRYNPSPAYFNTWAGSLKDEFENSEKITPTDKEQLESILTNKQDTLVSGTNIKTINNQSILGTGNINIEGGSGTSTDVQINGSSITSSGTANIVTEGVYNASTNKIATMSDIPDTSEFITKSVNDLTYYTKTSDLGGLATKSTVNYETEVTNKPTIPNEVTETTVSNWGFTKNTGTYSKPNGGIPKTDLASDVQTSLGKADTALQSYTEQYTGTITGITMNGVSKGTSGVVDLGTVITEHQSLANYELKPTTVSSSETTASITPQNNTIYQFGELTSLTITSSPATGAYSIIFTSGSTATTTVIPNTMLGLEDFAAEANTTYEINVLNNRAVVGSWAVSA